MKAILQFNLPEEQHEWRNAVDGCKMRSVLWDHDQMLRSKLKYDDLTNEQYQAYKECRDHLLKLLIEENINIHD